MNYSEKLKETVLGYCKAKNKVKYLDSIDPIMKSSVLRVVCNGESENNLFLDAIKAGFKNTYQADDKCFVQMIDFLGAEKATESLLR